MKQNQIPLVATIAVWILLYIIASLRFPGMLSVNVLLNLFTDNSFLGICAIGITFVILSAGIDLSVGAMVGCTSIIIAVLVRDLHLHPGMAILIVLSFGIIYGGIVGSLIHFFDLPPFMVTLAGMFFARGMGFVISVNSIPLNHPFYDTLSNFGIPIGDGTLTFVALTFILITLLGIFLAHRTRFGRNAYAIGGNETSARLMGLEVGSTKIAIYAFSGLCSALAGAVYSLYTYSGNAWAGNGMEMDAIAAAVIGGTLLTGGVGYVFGTLIGVLILGVIQTYITFDGTLSSWWTKIAIGILLFIFIALQRFMSQASVLQKPKTATVTKGVKTTA
ncbi:galactofuranose ABC transporter, permease protein YjfF [Hydrogenispora ethanolica]|uniref:galactofuranose ABC transporter, permease protein YjfF n=1 Tax=Hydrogenispora ethanolica TaxID=1082276 RepID=UPI003C77CAA1